VELEAAWKNKSIKHSLFELKIEGAATK
jgi:hypothetical protein